MPMKCLKITAIALGLTALPVCAAAQFNNADAAGYLARARAMLNDNNPVGCVDQLSHLDLLNPTPQQKSEASLLAALAAVEERNPAAAQMLKNWIDTNQSSPFRPEAMLKLGNCYFDQGDYEAALSRYRLIETGNFATTLAQELLYRRGYSYLAVGNTDVAHATFASMISSGEFAPVKHFYLGYIAYLRSDYISALSEFNAVGANAEYGPRALYYIAQIEFVRGNYDKALATAKRLIATKAVPEYEAEAQRIAGESLFNLGRENEAIPYLRAYIAGSGEEILPSTAYILGVSEYHAGDFGAAATMFKRVTMQDDAMGQSANLYLGQCYAKDGNTAAALMAFEKAYRMGFDKSVCEEALYNYAVAKSNGGRTPFGNSVALFESFLSQYPSSHYAPEVEKYILNGYMSDNDFKGALNAVARMRRPSTEALLTKQRALFMLGTREYAAGETNSAMKLFAEAATMTPSDASVARQSLLWQGTCLYDNGSYANAAECFRRYLSSAPASDANALLARYNLAYARYGAEQYEDALAEFHRVISSRPSAEMAADAYNRSGDCLYYKSNFADAAAAYSKAYEANPSSGDYPLYQQAVMKGLMRDNKGKIAGLDNMIDRFPSSALVPAALLEKAESYTALGNSDMAIGVYNELIAGYASSPYARKGLLQLAIANLDKGDRTAAVADYKRIITTYPTSDEARLAADDLKRIYADQGRLSEFAAFMKSVPDAPEINPSELDALAFTSAEADYINTDNTARIEQYLRDYPNGTHEAQAMYYLADAAASAGDDTKALKYASELLESYPDASAAEDALLIKAEAELALGKGELAMESYRLLAAKAGGARNLQEARLGLMRTSLSLGNDAQVIEAADALLSSSATPQSGISEIQFSKALALSRSGNAAEARDIWKRLSADVADVYGSKSAVALAENLLESGNPEAARTVADNFINANPPHAYWLARGFIVLSDALRAQGDTFEADEYLRTLKSNYPGTEADIFEMIEKRLDK
jgi:TolA-binding protein